MSGDLLTLVFGPWHSLHSIFAIRDASAKRRLAKITGVNDKMQRGYHYALTAPVAVWDPCGHRQNRFDNAPLVGEVVAHDPSSDAS
jgi:hypothetical protein